MLKVKNIIVIFKAFDLKIEQLKITNYTVMSGQFLFYHRFKNDQLLGLTKCKIFLTSDLKYFKLNNNIEWLSFKLLASDSLNF